MRQLLNSFLIVNEEDNRLRERKRYLKEAVEVLKVDKCIGNQLSEDKDNDKEIVIVVNRLKQIIK